MDIQTVKTQDDVAKAAAQKIADVINREVAKKGKAVIGLATGSTQIPVYRELVKLYNEGKVDFDKVITFNLDEYVLSEKDSKNKYGTGKHGNGFYEHIHSYHGFMQEHLFRHVNIREGDYHVPNGIVPDMPWEEQKRILEARGREYEEKIRQAGGIDLQLVGIGRSGHLGFNEIGSTPDSITGPVELTEETVKANQELFGFAVPHAITMGLSTIMSAKEILLTAFGESKERVLKDLGRSLPVESPEAIAAAVAKNPSHILHYHPNVTSFIDHIAAKGMLFSKEEIENRSGRPWTERHFNPGAVQGGPAQANLLVYFFF